MNFEEVLEQVAKEGAIRVYKISDRTGFVYRYEGRNVQAKGLVSINGEWQTTDRIVGSRTLYRPDGWHDVEGMPAQVRPIELDAAKKNTGYYEGLVRQCFICKKEKPMLAFEREEGEEARLCTWECNECYEARQKEQEEYEAEGERLVGDYVGKEKHTERPPIKGELD